MSWDERYRRGEYPRDPEPSPLLRQYAAARKPGRALDVATGTGRNAVYLADVGHWVDAFDRSREGLLIGKENGAKRDVNERIEWIQAEAERFDYPIRRYDLITISFFRALDRLADIKEGLADDGLLFVQHHLRTAEATERGPDDDRYRFAANELLHACLDLTVVAYVERVETTQDGRKGATVEIVARNSHGSRQTYPDVDPFAGEE